MYIYIHVYRCVNMWSHIYLYMCISQRHTHPQYTYTYICKNTHIQKHTEKDMSQKDCISPSQMRPRFYQQRRSNSSKAAALLEQHIDIGLHQKAFLF